MQPAPSPSKLLDALRQRKILLGVVHLRPLPGSPRNDQTTLDEIVTRAETDAQTLLDAGFDGYIIENFGDTPFFAERVPPHVLTTMTRVALALPRSAVSRPAGPENSARVGANVLRNDARGGLAVALAAGLDFIRVNVHCGAAVTDQGVIQGDAATTIRERSELAPNVAILADVDVKHAAPLGARFDIAEAARETAYRGLADSLIVTGAATGSDASPDDLRRVVEAVPDTPVFVGSGVTSESVRDLRGKASGGIVGTAVKVDGDVEQPVDADRAQRFVEAARSKKRS